MSEKLTDKQKRFCQEYLKDFNATAAYLRAGYKATAEAARRNASRMLTNADVQAYLQKLRSRVSAQAEITLERTLQEIGRIAFGDITNTLTFDSNGVQLKDSATLPKEVTAAIASVSSTETTRTFKDTTETNVTYKLQMHNKVSALSLLADFFGIRDDFNKARATLRRYGLLLIVDNESPIGWRLDRVSADSSSAESEASAIDTFTEEILDSDEAL